MRYYAFNFPNISPWGSFMEYWLMREMANVEDDLSVRSYLYKDEAWDNITHINSAGARLGYDVPRGAGSWKYVLDETCARLRAMGWYNVRPSIVRIRLNQWFCWDRLRRSEIHTTSQLPREARAALKERSANPLFD